MNSTWEFVKRHKNKIAAVATLVGGVYATKKILDRQGYDPSTLVKRFSSIHHNAGDHMLQSRKNFIFDSYQQTCDKQVKDTIQELLETLNTRFNTEELVLRLQNDETIGTSEKVELWNQIKLKTFSRLVALAYMHSIILVALKLQKSILCRETIKNYEITNQEPVGITGNIYSYFSEPVSVHNNPQMFTDAKAQEVFVNCIQYLTTHGINSLYDEIEACIADNISNLGLAKELTPVALKDLLEKLKFRIECTVGQSNFAELVVPVSKTGADSSNFNYSTEHLEQLLNQLSNTLQSTRAHAVVSSFVQRYINETVDFVENELETVKPVAVAKLLPILNASFPKLSSTSYDSVLQQNISSSELYQLCQMAFS